MWGEPFGSPPGFWPASGKQVQIAGQKPGGKAEALPHMNQQFETWFLDSARHAVAVLQARQAGLGCVQRLWFFAKAETNQAATIFGMREKAGARYSGQALLE